MRISGRIVLGKEHNFLFQIGTKGREMRGNILRMRMSHEKRKK